MEQQGAAEAKGNEYMEDDKDFDDDTGTNAKYFEMATSEARCGASAAQVRHHPGRADKSFSASWGHHDRKFKLFRETARVYLR